jgi:hypothetical protein
VPIGSIGERRTLSSSRQPVHGHHLTSCHADFEQLHPVTPQLAKCFLGQRVGWDKRAEFGTKQHFCSVNIADSRDNLLVHECSTDWRGCLSASLNKSFLASFIDERIRTEFATHSLDAGGAEHLAYGWAAKVGDGIGRE